MKQYLPILVRSISGLALTLVVLGLVSSPARAAGRGAELLQKSTQVGTFGAGRGPAGDARTMSCTRCETVGMTSVSQDKGRGIPAMVARHGCPDCQSTISTTGHGKAKRDTVNHSCGSQAMASSGCRGANSAR